MKFVPFGTKILVKRLPEEVLTEGGLYIPTGYERKAAEGYVEGVGPKATEDVHVGDRVMFSKYSGSDFPQMGDDYLIFAEDDLLGKIEDYDG